MEIDQDVNVHETRSISSDWFVNRFIMVVYHPVGSQLNSDWFVNSFRMVVYEIILLVPSEFCDQRTKKGSHRQPV